MAILTSDSIYLDNIDAFLSVGSCGGKIPVSHEQRGSKDKPPNCFGGNASQTGKTAGPQNR